MVLNLEPLKEPRGFIRLIQIVFALFCFSTACNFSGDGFLRLNCSGTEYWSYFRVDYPFEKETKLQFPINASCGHDGDYMKYNFTMDYSTSSEFFVTTGVLSLVYSLLFTGICCYMNHHYVERTLLPLFDLIGTAILTLFWFSGWCSWVSNSSSLKTQIHGIPNAFVTSFDKNLATIVYENEPKFGSITTSLLFGFGNVILWFGSCWFVYKDTHLNSEPMAVESPVTSTLEDPPTDVVTSPSWN